MHTITEFETNIPAFLAKLWNMVEEPNLDELIAWGANGLSFVIKDQNRFAKELLPMYYKHNNMASFIRQLNMYDFHKNISLESGCAKMEDVLIEFYHPCFQKNNPNLLKNIKRKINTGRGGAASAAVGGSGQGAGADVVVNQVLHDVRKMKSRQDSVDSRLSQMKMENEALWREVAILRQKHIKQQQIVNKLIQFLVSFVQHPHANGITVKRRNIPLMLQDRSVHSNQLNKNNQSLGGLSDITRSPTGPVIHEIDPNEYAASLLLNDVRGVDEGIASPQDAATSMLADNSIGQDNDESGADVVATANELLDLPNQLLAESALPSADELSTADRAEHAQTEQFTRPNQIRARKRRPRKPAATKKLPTKVVDVADESCPEDPGQPDIAGLVLDDFPLIIPGSQALEQLNNLPTTYDVTSPQTVSIEALTSPIVNLTADSPVPIVTTSPYSAELTEFTDPNTVIPIDAATIVNSTPTIVNSTPTIINSTPTILNSTPTIVNRTVPIVAPEKRSRYKKIAPKLTIPEPKSDVKAIRPQQRKRRSPTQSRVAGKKAKSSKGQDVDKSQTPSTGASKQMPTENNDRTVACMAPSNSQQSIKQEIDNHVDSMQNDLETLKELLKGESISLDANTLLGKLSSTTLSHYLTLNKNEGYDYDITTDLLFNSEDPFSLTVDLPTQTQTEDKLKEPDNNQIVSYTTVPNSAQELGDLFDDYNDWILSPSNEAATPLTEQDVYNIPELNTPDILMTPDPQQPLPKKKKK